MRKITALFLVFSLLLLPGVMTAQKKKGSDIEILKTDGKLVKGELIAVKQESLLLLDVKSNTDVVVNLNDVKVFYVIRTPYVVLGLLGGFIVGYLVGAGIGIAEGYEPQQAGYRYPALGGSLIGGGVGAITGGILFIDKKMRIHEMSEKEVQIALEELRRKARIPDYNRGEWKPRYYYPAHLT